MTFPCPKLKEAISGVSELLLSIKRPAKVYVLAPRKCGLEELAEEMANALPAARITVRCYKDWDPRVRKCVTFNKTNNKRGKLWSKLAKAIMVAMQANMPSKLPIGSDTTMPCMPSCMTPAST